MDFMFKDKNLLDKLRAHPKTKEFMKDPGYVKIMQDIQADSSSLM